LTPILITLPIHHWIIYILHHEVENSDWIWCQLSIKNLLVVSVIKIVHFLFILWKIAHKPDGFIFYLFRVSISNKKASVNRTLVIVNTGVRRLVIDQNFWRALAFKKCLYFFSVGVIHENCILRYKIKYPYDVLTDAKRVCYTGSHPYEFLTCLLGHKIQKKVIFLI
jgi:hypothetical protein